MGAKKEAHQDAPPEALPAIRKKPTANFPDQGIIPFFIRLP